MNELNSLSKSEWIWCNTSCEANQYAQFIHDFTIQAENATLYICADTNYAVFINGNYIPGFAFSDYPENRSVDTHDITPYIKKGVNRLCVVGYCQVTTSSIYKQGVPAVKFAIYSNDICIANSGTDTLSRQAPDYANGPVECISAQLSYTFHYDAQKYDGWLNCGYQPDSSWSNAAISNTTATESVRPVKQMQLENACEAFVQTYGNFTDVPNAHKLPCGKRMQQAYLGFKGRVTSKGKPLLLPSQDGVGLSADDGDGIYILIDLQKETVGLLTLDIELPQDACVMIGFGEHLDDLRVRSEVGGRQFCATYNGIVGRQKFIHYHKRLGCRYLQLHIYAPSVKLYYAGLLPVNYPLIETSTIDCKDRLLKKIYDVGIHTLRMCVHEHYEDCPWREQALYAMDSRIQMLCGYYAFSEYQMPRATIELLSKGIRTDGLLEMCAPTSRPRTIPSFSLSFIDCLYDYAQHSNDLDFVANLMPVTETILKTFLNLSDSQGFIKHSDNEDYWNFYEWSPGLDGNSSIQSPSKIYAPLQAMFIIAAQKYLNLCRITSHKSTIKNLEEKITTLRSNCQLFWDKDKQVFKTCFDVKLPESELVQALMIRANIPTNEQKEILLEKLSNTNNNLSPITLSHSIYKYEALMAQPKKYSSFVADEIAHIWGSMLFKGATTFWETELGAWDFFSAGSLCHGWSSIPVYLLHKYKDYLV